ncbi:uncharacterized protein LOC129568082 isoform X1 [Sitodiplosis mosellana]|uniref:uncharacterized protein LOC129568082 isoform X1 n=1 Tax=Sitodiplosis mosellana TaxID=263140 RepID=UPI002444DEDE|nr:uncharacterized protein LOC129568082 isoform X1 [Sitodiplosis mosellana]XP_055301601.1 uncharacterized protein LOC129568082 isoform X1 [Sitodiplosis mosellana]XP_055301602.1 uncharacterized protein LOC129568082 isoform X1 [Sitodiplosis mosellana]
MEQNLVKTQIDEHLMTIQRNTEATLNRFERSGLTVDKMFLDYLLKLSVDRLTQTCDRFETDAKYKMSCTVTAAMSPTSGTENSTPSLIEEIGDSMGKGENSVKRKADDAMKGENELLKRQKTVEKTVNNDKNDTTDQSQHLKRTIFFCVHCLDERNPIKSFSGTVEDVTYHWSKEHSTESKPFQFYAVALLDCFYCKKVGSYHDLIKHHKEKHADTQFIIVEQVDQTKCGMCHFKDGDLSEHFKAKHDVNSTPKIFNPICYSEERIAEFLTINVAKKHQCDACNQIFETQDEIGAHFQNFHNSRAVQSKKFVDNRITPDHLICGHCHKKVDSNRYLNHLSEHTVNFRCTMVSVCKYESVHLSQMAFHEKIVHDIDSLNYHCSIFPGWMKKKLFNTNMVFSNGLVLKTYNLLGTTFDDSKLLDKFIQKFLEKEKQQAKQMIEAHGEGMNLNGSSSDENRYRAANGTNLNSVPNDGNLKEAPNNANPPFETTTVTLNEEASAIALNVNRQNDQPNIELHEVENDASGSETDSISEPILMTALRDQQKLIKNLYVQGIPRSMNITDRNGTFLKLCKQMEVDISHSNIQSIDQCKKGFIVKLHRMDTKNLIMSQTRDKFVWSNELFKLTGSQKPWKVYINDQMTHFYAKMWFAAMDLKQKRHLHSYKLTKDGFVVKRTSRDDERVILSEEQLREYIRPVHGRRSQT